MRASQFAAQRIARLSRGQTRRKRGDTLPAASGLRAAHLTHDDDNLRAASTSTNAALASAERSMRLGRRIERGGARTTWGRIAWICITVNNYYRVYIIRT